MAIRMASSRIRMASTRIFQLGSELAPTVTRSLKTSTLVHYHTSFTTGSYDGIWKPRFSTLAPRVPKSRVPKSKLVKICCCQPQPTGYLFDRISELQATDYSRPPKSKILEREIGCHSIYFDCSQLGFVGIVIKDETGMVVFCESLTVTVENKFQFTEAEGGLKAIELFRQKFPKVKRLEAHIDSRDSFRLLNGVWKGPPKEDSHYHKLYNEYTQWFNELKGKFDHLELCWLRNSQCDMVLADLLANSGAKSWEMGFK